MESRLSISDSFIKMEDPTKPKRFYFYRDQLVVIVLAFAMAAALILVLGMIAGKTIARRRTVERPAAAVKIPVAPPSPGLNPEPEGSVTEAESSKGAGAEPAGREPKKIHPQEQSTRADLTKPPPLPQAAPRTGESKPGEKAGAATKVAPEESPVPPAKRESPDQAWTVQVKSSTDKAFADRWVDRLKSKGYDAFSSEADINGQTWYRVRVGHLDTRGEAETLQGALEAQEALSGTLLLKAPK